MSGNPQRPVGGTYPGGGPDLKRTFARKTDADAWEAKTRHDRDHGTYVDATNRTTVAEYFESWYQARSLRPQTIDNRVSFLRNHLAPVPLGSRPVVKVKPSEVQAWVRSRTDVIGPYALRITWACSGSMFAAAVLDGVIARNPVLPLSRLVAAEG